MDSEINKMRQQKITTVMLRGCNDLRMISSEPAEQAPSRHDLFNVARFGVVIGHGENLAEICAD
jgi:hypothetical protein